MPCRRFIVSGRVQGVWFRASTRDQANLLGLSGHARNLANGDVEVLACGDEEAIGQLRRWLAQGPPLARVDRVDEQPAGGESAAGFQTL